ncbi:hypothetical protein GQ44DRAFT_768587 [Phaeosphaeriaceae sp. PMI808]|nr:hypothetical protein GQ44DRAFT_768587 [Phaeosphaeriaceae sp. PMI808]
MSLCCRTCDHRNSAVQAFPSAPSKLDVCFIKLTFKAPVVPNTKPYILLNTILNNIVDSVDTASHPTTFTSWSPCVADPHIVIILSTAWKTCSSPASPVFDSLHESLAEPLSVQHVYLDLSVLSLAASMFNERIPVDIIPLQAPNVNVAAAMGKHFGWDPKRSSLSQHVSSSSATFNSPGDLIKDFWAWAELKEGSMSSSTVRSSFSSSQESLQKPSPLRNHDSNEKNMALIFPDEQDNEQNQVEDDETLLMIFQWSSRIDAERFKHPLQTSYGTNREEIRKDLWETQVAHPLRQFQSLGAKYETYKLELRAVEPRIPLPTGAQETKTRRLRSGSKRLGIMASELSGKVGGLWK